MLVDCVAPVMCNLTRSALYRLVNSILSCFLFQAEDGIRDWSVTGVQTCVFFFSSRRRHTRLVSDWSSDVCSSDLSEIAVLGDGRARLRVLRAVGFEREVEDRSFVEPGLGPDAATMAHDDALHDSEPHAGALELLRGVEALEHAEQPVRLAHVEPDAVVLHIVDGRVRGRLRRPRPDLHPGGVPPPRVLHR